jgi:hypothetical protein
MPLELQIIRAHEFIRLGARGRLDPAASRAIVADLARACRKRGIHQALLDLRALKPGPVPVFRPKDLVMLVSTFRDIGFTKKDRLAVLYHTDPHRRARLFAFISRMRGWSVGAFQNFEEALVWLAANGHSDVVESDPRRQKVAIRITRARTSRPAKFARRAGPGRWPGRQIGSDRIPGDPNSEQIESSHG